VSRRDRRGCRYDAYVPDLLAGWNLVMPADVAADVADAEAAIRDLNAGGATHPALEGLARFLLRAESVGSSVIESLAATPRRLVRAEAALTRGDHTSDQVAVHYADQIDALKGRWRALWAGCGRTREPTCSSRCYQAHRWSASSRRAP